MLPCFIPPILTSAVILSRFGIDPRTQGRLGFRTTCSSSSLCFGKHGELLEHVVRKPSRPWVRGSIPKRDKITAEVRMGGIKQGSICNRVHAEVQFDRPADFSLLVEINIGNNYCFC